MPAFLILFLLLCTEAVYSSSLKDFMDSNVRELHQYLHNQDYYIKFGTYELVNETFALTTRYPCPTPEDLFNCEVASGIPYHQITRSFHMSPTEQVLDFGYYYYGFSAVAEAVAIDVAYLKTHYVQEYVYPNLNFTGTPSIRLNDLTQIQSSEGYFSSYFYGYIVPPSNQGFRILIEHSGECVIWLDGQEYVREERPGLHETKGNLVHMHINYPFNFQATLKNSSGSKSIFRIFWDISGEWSQIPGEALYYPVRLSYAPYLLHSAGEGFYCEFGINSIDCFKCGQLCAGCNSEFECLWCNEFAYHFEGTCRCVNGFVQNPENMNECIECPPFCDSCYFTGSDQQVLCDVCVENAELVPGIGCRCKTGYYQVPESNLMCRPYYNLCTGADSQGSNENFECTSCSDSNAVFKDNQCYCDAGYYQFYYYDQCSECGGSACQTCEHRRTGITCKSCIEGASMYLYEDWYDHYHECRCDDGFYAMRPLGCLKCPDTCKTCAYDNYDKKLYCYCGEGYYNMDTNECLKCPSLCKYCSYYSYQKLQCFDCQENAKISGDDCICLEGYYKTRNDSDKCTTCEALCEVCFLDANEDLACSKCKENADWIEGVCKCIDRYTEPVYDEGSCVQCADRLCLRCTQYVASQPCNRCVDNAVDVNGECKCREGFFRTAEDTCSPCTVEFCKLCDEVECKECFNPKFLNDDGTCTCPSENYHTVDEECIPKDFTAAISSTKDSYLEINFSVPPLNAITSSDYSIQYSIPNLSSLLSASLSKLSTTSYSISFSSPYSLHVNSSLSITFKDSVEDAISQSLSTKKHSIEIRFHSATDCILISQLRDCQSCSSYQQSLKTCSRCDSLCRCIDASWDTCSEIVPRIEAATWNSDMLGFNMTFNIQIQATSLVKNECSHYFTSSSLSQLGISPICTLSQDLRNLIVVIGAECSLTLDSNISLSSKISSVYNSSKNYTNPQPESITPPTQYPNPTAVLSIPSIISDCNDLKADGTQSFGNRRALEYQWSVSGDDTDNINNTLKNEHGSIITILNPSFNNLNAITITLTVKNAFGMSDSTKSTVSISKKFVPEVILQGGSEIKIVTTATFSPQITLKWPVCKTPPTSYRTEWSFKPISNGQGGSNRRLQSSSENSQSYTITPDMLEADVSYNLTATVIPNTISQDSLPASATQIITTLPAPMFVTITRGNRQASVYKDAILDGSLSNDSSYPKLLLSYSWDCKESNINCDFIKDLNNTTSKELVIPAGKMKPDKTYTFTLSVSNSKRSSSTSAYLQTLNSTQIPEVYLFPYESPLSPKRINYLNPNYIVLANNELSKFEGLKLQWQIVGGPYILNSPSNQRSISIRDGSLSYGISYTFSLEVRYEDFSTTSSITLYVNTPPLRGRLKISPDRGRELEVYTFLMSGWEDVENNYPIRYELYKDVDNVWVKVIDLNYATIYEGRLSAGYDQNGYSTTYHIKAYDSLEAYSHTSSSVIVEPLPQELAESIAFNTIKKLSQDKEVENLDSIPYTVITLSDSILKFETNDTSQESRVSYVQDCLDLLSFYSAQDVDSTRQAASVISALERLTIQPQIVNEYSRNEAVMMLNASITKNEGNFKPDSVMQSVKTVTNLYLSSEEDSNMQDSSKNSSSIIYYNLLNSLGLAVVKNNIRNQDFSEISTNIYKVLYQRVGPSAMNSKNFTLPDGQIVFPSSISEDVISQSLEGLDDDSVIDLSFIYSQQNSFTNYSSSFNQSLYYIKNAGVMYLDVKSIGKENDVGGVDFEPIKTIELSSLEFPIEIYIKVEYINITEDQTPECIYLNELSMEWENSGCSFKEYLQESGQIVCECYHMSYYSVADFKTDLYEAGEDNQAGELNPKRLVEARFEDFYPVFIVMSLILIIHIVTSIYAFIIDRKHKSAPIMPFDENVAFRSESDSNLSFKRHLDDNNQQEVRNLEAGKAPKSPKPVHPIQTKSLYMVYQEVEMQRKTFAQLFILNNKLLELRYVTNHSLSKLERLSLLFYGIYANIFVLGFFYTLHDPFSFKDQLEQMAKATEFEIQDLILFIYTKLVVLAPLIILRWMMTRNLKTLKRSVKNRIGIVLIVIGYIGSLLGILLLGINFSKYAMIMYMLKAVKAMVIDVMILSHLSAFVKACIFYLIQKCKPEKVSEIQEIQGTMGTMGITDRI